ncbi:MAG: hypothetical protein ABSB42_00010 [Tepidisphaeraceae bacterium]
MSGRRVKAWLAFSVSLATVIAVCIGVFWKTSGAPFSHSGETNGFPVSAAPNSPAAASAASAISAALFQSGNAGDRQAALDGIWRLAASDPGKMADHLPAWLGALLQNGQFADVEGLTLVAIPPKDWDVPTVCTFQEARVRAFLGEGNYARALAEAKSYYNVALLADTPTAIDLLAQALARTKGLDVAEQFRKQQQAGAVFPGNGPSIAPSILPSIKVNGSWLNDSIDGTKYGSPYKFANQIAQGDLLLLADQPAEAERSFLKACDYIENDWDLPQALEGIARSVRAQDGSVGRAKAFISLLQSGGPIVPTGIALPSNLSTFVLRDAAENIKCTDDPVRNTLARPSKEALGYVALPSVDESSPSSFPLPVNNPVLLAKMAPQRDPITAQIQSDSASDRQAVIDGIWRLAAKHPSVMADHLLGWLGPLMQEKRYTDVEGLSLVAILKCPWWYPSIATFQEARVRALLVEGQNAQVLSEAKSYYDLSPVADTPTAIELLAQALGKNRGPAVGEEFRKQATATLATSSQPGDLPATLLKSIQVDDSRYTHGIAMTGGASQEAFGNQMSRGDLLLLADQPIEAEKAFIKACQFAKNPWDLPQAVDGIARCLRDQTGSLKRTREFLRRLEAGESTVSIGVAFPGNLDREKLRESAIAVDLPNGNSVARADLPNPPDSAVEEVDLPPASSETPFDLEANNLPTNDAVLVLRLGTMGDPVLRNWLVQWQARLGRQAHIDARSIEPGAPKSLGEALDRSPLPSATLLNIAVACFQISRDGKTAAAILSLAVPASDPALRDWLVAWQDDLSDGTQVSDTKLDELGRTLDHATCDCATLARLGRAIVDFSNDARVSGIICGAAMALGHQNLVAQKRLTPAGRAELAAMKDVEPIVWEVNDIWGDHRYLKQLSDMSDDIQRLVPPQDPELGWLVNWARIVNAETLYARGRFAEAWTAAQSLREDSDTGPGWGDSQKVALHWLEAMILDAQQRPGEAIPHLEIVAEDSSSQHPGEALVRLVGALARTGQVDEAQKRLEEWIRRCPRPDRGTAIMLAEEIAAARRGHPPQNGN